MPRLIAALIRHGDYHQAPDTPSALQPYPLNAKGRQQALDAAALVVRGLEQFSCTLDPVIDSSELLRGWETASRLAEALPRAHFKHLVVKGFDALAERSVGSAANLTLQAIEAAIRDDPRFDELPHNWKSDSHFRLPLQGAESLMDAGTRVASHLHERMAALAETAETDTLKLFVGHGAAFRHAAHRLGVLEFSQIGQLSMHHAQPIYLSFEHGHWQQVGGNWKPRKLKTVMPD